MSYTPPNNDDVDFSIDDSYNAPQNDDVNFQFDSVVEQTQTFTQSRLDHSTSNLSSEDGLIAQSEASHSITETTVSNKQFAAENINISIGLLNIDTIFGISKVSFNSQELEKSTGESTGVTQDITSAEYSNTQSSTTIQPIDIVQQYFDTIISTFGINELTPDIQGDYESVESKSLIQLNSVNTDEYNIPISSIELSINLFTLISESLENYNRVLSSSDFESRSFESFSISYTLSRLNAISGGGDNLEDIYNIGRSVLFTEAFSKTIGDTEIQDSEFVTQVGTPTNDNYEILQYTPKSNINQAIIDTYLLNDIDQRYNVYKEPVDADGNKDSKYTISLLEQKLSTNERKPRSIEQSLNSIDITSFNHQKGKPHPLNRYSVTIEVNSDIIKEDHQITKIEYAYDILEAISSEYVTTPMAVHTYELPNIIGGIEYADFLRLDPILLEPPVILSEGLMLMTDSNSVIVTDNSNIRQTGDGS